MNKYFLLLAIIILMPFLFAAPPIKNTVVSGGELIVSSNIPTAIPVNSTREWEVHIINSTKHFNDSVSCILHIYKDDGDGGHAYRNFSNTFKNYDIEFITTNVVHQKKGEYSYKIICNTTSQVGLYEAPYYVTQSGNPPAEDTFTMFIYILFIIAILGLISTLFLNVAKLATAEMTVYDVLASWSFLILNIIVFYLGKEYLLRPFVETISGQLITLTIFSNGLLPLIALIISMIIKSTQKKRVLTVAEFAGRSLS